MEKDGEGEVLSRLTFPGVAFLTAACILVIGVSHGDIRGVVIGHLSQITVCGAHFGQVDPSDCVSVFHCLRIPTEIHVSFSSHRISPC